MKAGVGVTPLSTPGKKKSALFFSVNNEVVSSTYNFWVLKNALFIGTFRCGCKFVSDFVKGVY